MDGLLLVDKPAGWTSHDAVAYIRRALGTKRAGHTGTLDPDATGLVLALVGKSTRLAKYFEQDTKRYDAVMLLGTETDTQDASGAVIRECGVPEISVASVRSVMDGFLGEISQLPPMYSAVKVGGNPLYKSARAGVEVERKQRAVTVHELSISSSDGPRIGFTAVCSKGTYIRTLCRDIAEALGSCGHMESLRRTGAGGYGVEQAISLETRPGREELEAALIPIEEMLPAIPRAVAEGEVKAGISNGRAPFADELVFSGHVPVESGPVMIIDGEGRIAAISTAMPDVSTGRLLLKLDAVFS
jgi:tRNA pseudouridine55 synthase